MAVPPFIPLGCLSLPDAIDMAGKTWGSPDKFAAWQDLRGRLPEFKLALKARGADIIIMEGRKGWARVFPGAAGVRQTYEVRL